MLWNAISYVLRGQFCLKCSLNQLSVSCLFMFVFENNGAGYQFQLQYTLFFYKYHKNSYEISEMSKSGFSYPDQILVGIRDFQAKQGESRRDRDGWTVWSLDILLYRSFATLKCEHNAIFLSNGLISVATCVIGCFDVFYALWLAEKIRPRFSTNQKKIKLLRTNRISFLAVFPPLRNWFHNNIT